MKDTGRQEAGDSQAEKRELLRLVSWCPGAPFLGESHRFSNVRDIGIMPAAIYYTIYEPFPLISSAPYKNFRGKDRSKTPGLVAASFFQSGTASFLSHLVGQRHHRFFPELRGGDIEPYLSKNLAIFLLPHSD